jgi:hypothetical protein
MKMPIGDENPPVLRPAPFAKGGHWGIYRRCSEPLRLILMRRFVPTGT